MIHLTHPLLGVLGRDVRQVGPDLALVGQVRADRALAADRVAAGAAVLDDPLVARLELLRLRDVGHLGVALQAARLDEPLGEHREIPEMELVPVVLLVHSSACLSESGVCEAKVKSVPEPWPPWQIVQPKLLIGCGPLPSR